MAEVCQYGGQAKGDGTQGCSCFTAPDCSSTEKCPLGLGGEPKADGTQSCNCKTTETLILKAGTSKGCDNPGETCWNECGYRQGIVGASISTKKILKGEITDFFSELTDKYTAIYLSNAVDKTPIKAKINNITYTFKCTSGCSGRYPAFTCYDVIFKKSGNYTIEIVNQ